ncbi:MAG: hypothetical protein COV07_04410 [Candidatus Vogelbacteria bacterium CG10_big_fil_rev_8_21_14_0_10_45_14]|uniref:MurNAc-LAA domain-containing protein n=1 Tax=Candidatus Vogelbacteria bacterium CG10_big_fil_rev_8_21_14_0_10_45_14 TaxID=1975042 RepID=A0A2H0RIC5_9BACT|nr:MAG: hypothetical protein COV07_04410 [Candidatus Vogelbacteria bacterium CG10_big_fil_rev_8_21_14_0_10_45_14]
MERIKKKRRGNKNKKVGGLNSSFFVAVVILFVLFLYSLGMSGVSYNLRQLAGLFYAETITPEGLKESYKERPLRVVIVPGHDNVSKGSHFRGLNESDLNIELAYKLLEILSLDPKFHVWVSREQDGEYADWFRKYKEENQDDINTFIKERRSVWNDAANLGFVDRHVAVERSDAPSRVAFDLYAMNKYAAENEIDVLLHIHWNDYAGRKGNTSGKYSGFSIYVPEYQMPNSRASIALAEALRDRLSQFFAKSNMPLEEGTIIEDQELIAVGSNASQKKASILIEYGYIYESQFLDKELRSLILSELAHQTYFGILDFFEEGRKPDGRLGALLPYEWKGSIPQNARDSKDVLSMQVAMAKEGVYPPSGKTLTDCPISGNFGPCTKTALAKFQEKHGSKILSPLNLVNGTGVVGDMTILVLNELYGR